jgi:hypothetical protein
VGRRAPIASGAQLANFIADEAYEVTPMVAGFADVLSRWRLLASRRGRWGKGRRLAGRSCLRAGLEGRNFMEYDLSTCGGLSLLGRKKHRQPGFDTEQNRPTNLRIPLRRKVKLFLKLCISDAGLDRMRSYGAVNITRGPLCSRVTFEILTRRDGSACNRRLCWI